MSFKVDLHKRVTEFIEDLPRSHQEDFGTFISFLQENPFQFQKQTFVLSQDSHNYDIEKCRGHKNRYRVRLGDYRAYYEIFKDENRIFILKLRPK
jgi:mRNA-degrading endonuclease RelE of RelBE toxin-antitoxin system